ncbi:hypothetical protein Tco_1240071, partial [Tanacetum coccineum]
WMEVGKGMMLTSAKKCPTFAGWCDIKASAVFIVLVILLVFLVVPVHSPILAAGVDLHESTTYLATGVDLDESNEVHKLIESTTEVVIVDHVFKEESTEVV